MATCKSERETVGNVLYKDGNKTSEMREKMGQIGAKEKGVVVRIE